MTRASKVTHHDVLSDAPDSPTHDNNGVCFTCILLYNYVTLYNTQHIHDWSVLFFFKMNEYMKNSVYRRECFSQTKVKLDTF